MQASTLHTAWAKRLQAANKSRAEAAWRGEIDTLVEVLVDETDEVITQLNALASDRFCREDAQIRLAVRHAQRRRKRQDVERSVALIRASNSIFGMFA